MGTRWLPRGIRIHWGKRIRSSITIGLSEGFKSQMRKVSLRWDHKKYDDLKYWITRWKVLCLIFPRCKDRRADSHLALISSRLAPLSAPTPFATSDCHTSAGSLRHHKLVASSSDEMICEMCIWMGDRGKPLSLTQRYLKHNYCLIMRRWCR